MDVVVSCSSEMWGVSRIVLRRPGWRELTGVRANLVSSLSGVVVILNSILH